ncbi:hypothetical protein EGT74_25680 [Chitinophaga lutea]|uniref:YCII-related domain-containing protein n=1 Tax=Chitinophaga lutea TaxID=2488634 RepID=A0A3N4PN64_9BACT|nr:YciI family protein [Chitinophaga lutea]RPE05757.1 hypothetical protein EGT74_25680 [Chitinophaga lutea]
MSKLYALVILSLISFTAAAQKPAYDKALADSLGADDYGMKMYVLVILKSGSNTTTDKKVTDSLFRGHMNNIGRLAAEGKLVVAGPMKKNDKSYRGIFILNAKTVEEGRALLETDPAVQAKIFDTEIYEWYGSAALPTYLPNHDRVSKKSH